MQYGKIPYSFMNFVASYRPLIVKAQIQSQASLCVICSGQTTSRTCVSQSTLVLSANTTPLYRCFIMFSVITNIYNKKTKGPTLKELFTATGKLRKFFFFLTTRDVRCVHHGRHGTRQYDIEVLQQLMGDHLISARTDTKFH